MSENQEEIIEQPTTHKKTMQKYALFLIAVLCIVMIFSEVRKMNKEEAQEEISEGVVESGRMSYAELELEDDQERFSKLIADEARRIKQQQEADVDQETPAQTMERLQRHKTEERENRGRVKGFAEKVTQKSFEDSWAEQERERALRSRRVGFGLKGKGEVGVSLVSDLKGSLRDSRTPINAINSQQELIQKEIEEMEELQQSLLNNNAGSPAAYFPAGVQGQNVEPEDLVVGQPGSEKQPEPGQLLLPTATVIKAVLDQETISDYPGGWRGMIVDDVYDISMDNILIPKGSRVIGKALRIKNVNEPIQARMGLTVNWCILPDGKRISFTKTASVLDRAGVAAIKDKVNYHFMAQFLGVAAYALLSSETDRTGSGFNADQTFEGEVGDSLREQYAPLAAKYLNLVPTVRLRSGTPVRIFIEDDVYVFPWKSVYAGFVPRS